MAERPSMSEVMVRSSTEECLECIVQDEKRERSDGFSADDWSCGPQMGHEAIDEGSPCSEMSISPKIVKCERPREDKEQGDAIVMNTDMTDCCHEEYNKDLLNETSNDGTEPPHGTSKASENLKEDDRETGRNEREASSEIDYTCQRDGDWSIVTDPWKETLSSRVHHPDNFIPCDVASGCQQKQATKRRTSDDGKSMSGKDVVWCHERRSKQIHKDEEDNCKQKQLGWPAFDKNDHIQDTDPDSKTNKKSTKRRKWKVPPPEGFRGFAGKEDVLSNFFPCELYVYDKKFHSTEQAYQWRKAVYMGNEEAAQAIMASRQASEAKRIANQHFRAVDLSRWIPQRIPVMKQLLRAKARCCQPFRDELLRTGDKFIAEVVPGDHYWALGDGTGSNVMGKLLMELRSNLDEALSADPDEDGKLIDFPDDLPDPYSSKTEQQISILLIVDQELAENDFNKLVRGFNIKKLIVPSFGDVDQHILNENISQYSMVVLHLLSYETLMRVGSEAVICMHTVTDKILSRINMGRVLLSLPAYPAMSPDSDYSQKASDITSQLFRSLKDDNRVICQRNSLHLDQETFFTKDDKGNCNSISCETRLMLAKNLANSISLHLNVRRRRRRRVKRDKNKHVSSEGSENVERIWLSHRMLFVVVSCAVVLFAMGWSYSKFH